MRNKRSIVFSALFNLQIAGEKIRPGFVNSLQYSSCPLYSITCLFPCGMLQNAIVRDFPQFHKITEIVAQSLIPQP